MILKNGKENIFTIFEYVSNSKIQYLRRNSIKKQMPLYNEKLMEW